jgi:hypothetical protein
MNAHIPDTHAQAWALLPWLANGRIQAADREWVEAHVQGCAECRAELAAQRLVASEVNREGADSPLPAASEEQRSFNKLWARIELRSARALPLAPPRSGFRAAFVAHRALAGGRGGPGHRPRDLGVAVNNGRAGAGGFVTVSSPEPRPHAPAVRVVFDPSASISTVNTLLEHQGLSIVSAPAMPVISWLSCQPMRWPRARRQNPWPR